MREIRAGLCVCIATLIFISIPSFAEESKAASSIDGAAIEAALLEHRDEFRLCYEREINADNPDLKGRVDTQFTIEINGEVKMASIKSSTLKNARAEACILNVIRRISSFPKRPGGSPAEVSYPFKFSPSKK